MIDHKMSAMMTPTVSPSLGSSKSAPAFEMKFLLDATQADEVTDWAFSLLQIDLNASSPDGTYETTSLYTDTVARDVLHRSSGYRRRKYRVRRYADGNCVFLEEKKRKGHRVSKRREAVPIEDLPGLADVPGPIDQQGNWFHSQLAEKMLRPVCQISYRRTAFAGGDESDPMRVTLDREIRGQRIDGWWFHSASDAIPILSDSVVLELKFRGAMPCPFKQLLEAMHLMPTGVSKYRYCMMALEGSAGEAAEGVEHA